MTQQGGELVPYPTRAAPAIAAVQTWTRDVCLELINDEAEMAVIGAILHNNRLFEQVSGFLKPEMFGSRVHQRIFAAIAHLIDHGSIADPLTLKDYFEHDQDLTEIGGFAYLMRLAGSVASILGAEAYGRAVRDMHLRRLGVQTAALAIQQLADPKLEADVGDIIAAASHTLGELAVERKRRTARTFDEVAREFAGEVDLAAKGQAPTVTTGIPDLDRVMAMRRKHQILLAGATSSGKTALAGSIAFNLARWILKHGTGERIVWFSIEMAAVEMFARAVAPMVGISADAMLGEQLDDMEQYSRILRTAAEVADWPIDIVDVRGITTAEMRAEARRIARKHPLALIGVDHMGLVRHPDARREERLKLKDISLDTREMAEEFNCPVLALCQLKRFERPNMRPTIQDLRESGDLEQNADVIALLYREEYYLAQKEPAEATAEHVTWQEQMDVCANEAEVNVAKRRMGPTGRIKLHFDGPTTSFTARYWQS